MLSALATMFWLVGTFLLPAASAVSLSKESRLSALAPARAWMVINGLGDRNNPFRQKLAEPFHGDTLFARFDLIYKSESVDTPLEKDGEFLVFWMDDKEGNDLSTHNGGIPNIGIHVTDEQNRFMVRFNSSRQVFSKTQLKGDTTYRVVARLWKSRPGKESIYDSLDLWVDPKPGEENNPHASTTQKNGIKEINWVGFSTGRKTEPTDEILLSEIQLESTWTGILGVEAEVAQGEPEKPAAPPKPHVDFAKQVYPILKQQCFDCHSGEKAKQGLRLDLVDELLNQVHPGQPGDSKLITLITSSNEDDRMPPGPKRKPLTPEQVEILATWIEQGVEWDETLLPTPVAKSDHWAFQPIQRPEIPDVAKSEGILTPVDAFIRSHQEEMGVTPGKPAAMATLKRRIALDLTGLPVSALQHLSIKPDLEDQSQPEDALKLWIDQLLASREYGERWGRHWLDIARFGESNGHQHNRDRPYAWRYRDYVIASFQNNKPFDRFLTEQIAGDELPYADENLIATGFLAAARYSGNELDKEIQRNDILVDVANTTAKAFLGLTMECAQCHTHKFDPISIRDYYRFQAFFAKGQPGNVVMKRDQEKAAPLIKRRWEIFDKVHHRLVEARRRRGYPEPVLVIPKSVVGGMNKEERAEFNVLEKKISAINQTWAWMAPSSTEEPLQRAPHEMRWPLERDPQLLASLKSHILLRGEVKSKGPVVHAGWPAVFGPGEVPDSKPRTALAGWLTSPGNPLTARVWVNRVWQWHFGKGLVDTSADFGTQGTPPSHPGLLDWLASELIQSGWDTAHLHRLILHSATYQQSDSFDKANESRDPDNLSYWRWEPRRIEAEAIHDSILAIANLLEPSEGGPSVPVDKATQSHKRSIYAQQKRDRQPLHQTLFDAPNTTTSCARRRVSTVALQPLFLLNSSFMEKAANSLAERVRKAASSEDPEALSRTAIETVLERPATDEEVAKAGELLEATGLPELCLALLNLNEFLYIP